MANNKKYISIDSNILRAFLYLDVMLKSYVKNNGIEFTYKELPDNFNFTKFLDLKNCNDPLLRLHTRGMCYLYLLFKKDKIRMYVTEAVYNENKHSKNCCDFIRDNCFMHKIMTESEKEKFYKKVSDLVNDYTSPQTVRYKGELMACNPPMKVEYLEHLQTYVPTNDCYIMAESTVDNCTLLTGNGKDFIFDIKDDKEFYNPTTRKFVKKKSRTLGIVDVNIKNGYYSTGEDDNKIVPKPIDIDTLARNIQRYGVDNFELPEVNEEDITFGINRLGL